MVYALITGASKGIGKAFAYELASRKHNLILTARSESLLQNLAEEIKNKFGVDVLYYSGDLCENDFINDLFLWTQKKKININMVINNAGFGLWGKFCQLPIDDQIDMMNLNMSALVSLTYKFIPVLSESKQSYILNVASVASYLAIPTFSIYAATKAFVLSFSRSLKLELNEKGVRVCCLCPGATESEFLERAGMQSIGESASALYMSAEEVAKIGINGMLKGKTEIVPGFFNKLTKGGIGLAPKGIMERIAGMLYDDRKPSKNDK